MELGEESEGPRPSDASLFDSPTGAIGVGAVDFHGPPRSLAAVTLLVGLVSTGCFFVLSGPSAWFGWAVGFAAVLSGIAYRWVIRRIQAGPMFLPDYLVDRTMLVGVLLGFFGIVLNALHVAQRVIE